MKKLVLSVIIGVLTTVSALSQEPVEIVGRDVWTRYGITDGTAKYRGDLCNYSRHWEGIYDDDTNDGMDNEHWWHSYHKMADYMPHAAQPNAEPLPMYFTIDMDRAAAYTGMKFWGRLYPRPIYTSAFITGLEVWASNSPKTPLEVGSGSIEDNLAYWTSWTQVNGTDAWKQDWVKLADWSIQFPSGRSAKPQSTDESPLSAEDEVYVMNGFDIAILPEAMTTAYRYLRFVVKDLNVNYNQVQLAELKMWGIYGETGIQTLSPTDEIKCYFPTASSELHIRNARNAALQVLAINGIIVHSQELSGDNETVNLGKLPAGMYLARIIKDKNVKTVKVLKTK